MNDEIAHVCVVDGLLRLGLPCDVGARVIWVDADDLDLLEILELGSSELGEFTAKDKMQQLRFRCGRVCRHGQFYGSISGKIGQLYANSAFRSRTSPIRARWRARPAATREPRGACEPLYFSGLPVKSVSAPPASCTKRSAAARSQSWLPREAKEAARDHFVTRP